MDLVTGEFDKFRKMLDDNGIFVVDNEESKPPVDEVDDLFGIWDLELGPDQVVSSEGNISVKSLAPFDSDWSKLLDSATKKTAGNCFREPQVVVVFQNCLLIPMGKEEEMVVRLNKYLYPVWDRTQI